MTQIENSLSSLTNRIETYLERAHEFQCHRMASEAILKISKTELSNEELTHSKTTSSIGPAKTTRPPSIQPDKATEPEQQLAQSLGISLPSSDSQEASISTIEKILSERVARLESQESNLQSTFESSISSHLEDACVTLALLHDVLLDNSNYHGVKLADPELLDAVGLLETEVSQAQARLDALDLYDLQSRNDQRDHFLEHWLQ